MPRASSDRIRNQPEPAEVAGDPERQAYWRATMRVSGVILAIWFLVSFVLVWYARELNFNFFGWPFAFYMGAQGSLIVYVC